MCWENKTEGKHQGNLRRGKGEGEKAKVEGRKKILRNMRRECTQAKEVRVPRAEGQSEEWSWGHIRERTIGKNTSRRVKQNTMKK